MNRAVAGLSAGQWAARAAVAAMPLAALLCLAGADDAAPLWLVVVVAITSVYWAAVPESAVGAPILAVVTVCWGLRTGADVDPLVLPAAGALLVAHVAAVVASYGPATMRLDAAVGTRGLVSLFAPMIRSAIAREDGVQLSRLKAWVEG